MGVPAQDEGRQMAETCLDVFLYREKVRIWQYDFALKRIQPVKGLERYFLHGRRQEDVPESWIEHGDVHPSSRGDLLGFFADLSSGMPAGCTVRFVIPAGGFSWYRITGKPVMEGDKPVGAVCVSSDAPAQMNMEKRFFQEEQMRSMLSEDVIAASKVNLTEDVVEYVWGRQVDPEILRKVKTFEQMFDVGMNSILTEDDRKRYRETFSYPALLHAFDMGKANLSLEYRYKGPDGNIIWTVMSASMIRDPRTNDLQYYSFIRDIDEKKRTELMLREKAERDAVTGLYNKSTTESMIRGTLDKNQDNDGRCAMLMIDLDGFKSVNDNYGHPYGDYILTETGNALLHAFGTRAVKGRVGGDEFAVFIAPIPSDEWVCQKARECCGEMRQLSPAGQSAARLTGSVGIAFSPLRGAAFETLYEQADTALYEAKRAGKDRYAVYHNQTRGVEPYGRDFCLAKDFLSKTCMLDELEEMVFVIDAESYELLYLNRAAMERLGVTKYHGRKCYEVIQGYSQPCLFCRRHLPQENSFQVWENTNTRLRHSFIIKDKMMRCQGRLARFEIFLDADTFQLRGEESSIAGVLFDSVEILHDTGDETAAIGRVLRGAGEFYGADAAHILDVDERRGVARILHEWRSDKAPAAKGALHEIDLRSMPRWKQALAESKPIIVKHIDDIRESEPGEYHFLNDNHINSLYSVPFTGYELLDGFIGIFNPSLHLGELSFLESLAYLTGLEIFRRRSRARESYVSRHDPLTGLLNRGSYAARVGCLDPDAVSSLGVLAVDVNALKSYNRNFGYSAGDALLCSVGEILRAAFGADCAYRLGGGEFQVLCVNTTYDAFRERAEQVRERLKDLGGNGAATGFAWAGEDIDADRLCRHAEELLQLAKQEANHRTGGDRDLMLAGLERALSQGVFRVYLQPKARCESGAVRGAEALTRYVDEAHGVVPPGKFIPLLESARLIDRLDTFMFEEVCRLLQRWSERGYELFPVSLNFSRSTLLRSGLIPWMNECSGRYGVRRELLEIEITESFSEMELETLRDIGGGIVENGYRLALDDFGAQYSNISVLSALKLDALKLDKSIVNNLYSSGSVKVVVRNLLEICRELGVQSVAEGVETSEQLEILRGMRCDYLQGYLFNKPIPAEDFECKYMRRE